MTRDYSNVGVGIGVGPAENTRSVHGALDSSAAKKYFST